MHRITYFDDKPFEQYARCRCGFTTKKHRTYDNVVDEVRRHEENVERARLALGTRTPSLKSQAAYFRQMAEDPNVEPHDRRAWANLAAELEQRIGGVQTEQDGLFDMTATEKKIGDRT